MLGAFFIATDPVSGATTPRGKLIFGLGAGFLTMAIRTWGGFPDGVAFAILLMNICVPLIDQYTQPLIYGGARKTKEPPHDPADSGRPENALRTGVILFVFALVGTAILAFTYDRTEPTITRGQRPKSARSSARCCPPRCTTTIWWPASRACRPTTCWAPASPRRSGWRGAAGAFSGVVLEAIAPDGYSGDIALLIGIDANGTVTGVRVTAHHETPGLGDYIDRAKSPWIDQFRRQVADQPGAQALEGEEGRRRVRRPCRRHHHPARGGQGGQERARLFCAAPRELFVAPPPAKEKSA